MTARNDICRLALRAASGKNVRMISAAIARLRSDSAGRSTRMAMNMIAIMM